MDNHRPHLVDGKSATYAVVVANAGPNRVASVTLDVARSGTLADAAWACMPMLSSATCPAPMPALPAVQIDLEIGEHLRFDLVARADAAVGAFARVDARVLLPDGTIALATAGDTAGDDDPIVPVGLFGDDFEPASALSAPAARDALQHTGH